MKLFEIETKRTAKREEVAAMLHELADSLARHNELSFKREGIQYRIKVANDLEVEVELEVGDEGNNLEIELSW